MNTTQHYTYDTATNLVRRVSNTNIAMRHYQPVRTTSNRLQAHSYDTAGNQQHSDAQSAWLYHADGSLAQLNWQVGGYQYLEYYTYAESGRRARKVTEMRRLDSSTLMGLAIVNYLGDIEFRITYEDDNLSYDGDKVTDENGAEVAPISQRTVTRIKDGHGQVGKLEKNELTGQQRTNYNALNHIDSNELAFNEEGNLSHYRQYAPYGETVEEVKADDGNPMELGYSGQERDQSGLVYYGHRYLQTKSGIWNRADPIRFESGQLNLYSMLEGNPVSGRDEGGLLQEAKIKGTGFRNRRNRSIYNEKGEIVGSLPADTQIAISEDIRSLKLKTKRSLRKSPHDVYEFYGSQVVPQWNANADRTEKLYVRSTGVKEEVASTLAFVYQNNGLNGPKAYTGKTQVGTPFESDACWNWALTGGEYHNRNIQPELSVLENIPYYVDVKQQEDKRVNVLLPSDMYANSIHQNYRQGFNNIRNQLNNMATRISQANDEKAQKVVEGQGLLEILVNQMGLITRDNVNAPLPAANHWQVGMHVSQADWGWEHWWLISPQGDVIETFPSIRLTKADNQRAAIPPKLDQNGNPVPNYAQLLRQYKEATYVHNNRGYIRPSQGGAYTEQSHQGMNVYRIPVANIKRAHLHRFAEDGMIQMPNNYLYWKGL